MKTFGFYFTVTFTMLFISAVDSFSMLQFLMWAAIDGAMIYGCYRMFKGKTEKEIMDITGYTWISKKLEKYGFEDED